MEMAEQNSEINHHPPLCLQVTESPGQLLILVKLTKPENYDRWNILMKLSMQGKGNPGFIDETCSKNKYKGDREKLWKNVM